MRAGTLRNRVTVQRIVPTPDGQGGQTNVWTDVVTVWASVEARGGREFMAARQQRATLTDEVRMRYRTGITADMRLVVGNRVLSIAQPPMDLEGRRRELVIFCEENPAETA